MSKGKRRAEREMVKETRTLEDLRAYKGISKFQRKKLEQKGVDVQRFFGGTS